MAHKGKWARICGVQKIKSVLIVQDGRRSKKQRQSLLFRAILDMEHEL